VPGSNSFLGGDRLCSKQVLDLHIGNFSRLYKFNPMTPPPIKSPLPAVLQPDAVAEKCSPWLLLAMPMGVGLALGVVVSIIRSLQEVDARSIYLGLDGMRFPLAMTAVGVSAGALSIVWFRPRIKTMAVLASLFAFAVYGAYRTVRIDSFYGNMIPRMTWRWTPTAEQEIATYLTATSKSSRKPEAISDFSAAGTDFPGFLGAHRDATVRGVDLRTDWDIQPPKVLWRHPVGLGWSSFAIVGGVAINLEQRGGLECVVCYRLLTGEELWCHSEPVRFEDEHGDGPRSTPAIHTGRVLSMGANGTLTCLELETGNLIWKRDTLPDPKKQNLLWGMSGSPLVYDGQVLVTPGAGEDASAISYSLATGNEVWRSGEDKAGYSSPVEARLCGERQLLSFNGAGLRSYAIDGTPLWLHPWLTQGESQRVNVAQPVVLPANSDAQVHAQRVLISSGYDNGTALLEITRRANEYSVEVVWLSKHLKSKMSNFIVYGQHIYGLDNGILTCIDLLDGERRWKRGRYGHGQMLLVGDKLLIQAESGEVALVAASPESHQEFGRFNALSSKTWNNLALAGNVLVVRNDREAAAFELPAENEWPKR
jgi:outer membrane protein assembly factor BamB